MLKKTPQHLQIHLKKKTPQHLQNCKTHLQVCGQGILAISFTLCMLSPVRIVT